MKKINKCYVIFVCSLVVTVILPSCNDYLDQDPMSDITPEEYLWDVSQLASYTIDRYEDILPSHENWSFGIFGKDAGTDKTDRTGPGQKKTTTATTNTRRAAYRKKSTGCCNNPWKQPNR